MKKQFLFGLVAICFALTGFTYSQNKVAHIDVQKLLSEMPEMKNVQSELKKLEETYTADLQSSMKELQTKVQTYENEAKALSQAELEKRADEFRKKAEELQTMDQNIQQARQTAGQELQKKQQEMLTPLMTKAQAAIQKIAKAQGYQYVLDASPGSGVILADGKDLYLEVKKDLGF